MFSQAASNTRVFITAGDPSGDVHAAHVMQQLRLLVPDIVFEGFGGPAMEMQGLRSLAHISKLAVTGFWEVAKRYGYFKGLLNTCAKHIATTKPSAFIPVDYPGFNLRLAKHAKQARVPVLWYIAPQLWAWGKNRGKGLAENVDSLMVVFPFEVEFFRQFGIQAQFVGHPLCEGLSNVGKEARVASPLQNSPTESPRIVLMPGSRKQEIIHHVPLLAKTVGLVQQQLPGSSFTVLKAKGITENDVLPLTELGVEVATHSILEHGAEYTAGIIKAGTSTLEATLGKVPYTTFYKTSAVSYQLSKYLVNVESVTMANLLLGKPLVNEYLQERATPELLAKEVRELVTSTERRTALLLGMQEVRNMLGTQRASVNAANHIASVITR